MSRFPARQYKPFFCFSLLHDGNFEDLIVATPFSCFATYSNYSCAFSQGVHSLVTYFLQAAIFDLFLPNNLNLGEYRHRCLVLSSGIVLYLKFQLGNYTVLYFSLTSIYHLDRIHIVNWAGF